MEFKELGLPDEILKAITKLGFVTPSEIQEKAIPILSAGERDFVGLAQTGTGKTAAFGLPLIQHVDFKSKDTQGLIICPTRELCMQITKDLVSFAYYQTKPNIVPVYGGSSISDQIRLIKRGAHIVVATPGRLLDLINRKAIKLQTVQRVILDEADEMLNMGFKEDIDGILEQTPAMKRVWLFSATMPKAVRRIANNYMVEPEEIVVGKQNSVAANIDHRYYMMKERDRYYAIKRILDYYPDIFGLIFCRTRRETAQISDKLEKEGYDVVSLHGDLSQAQRDAAMKKFRERTVKVLVATDVAARGLDVHDISHVIHYNLPDDIENYTHRSGRTARAGKAGKSLVLINTRELHRIKQIEKMIGANITYRRIPEAEDICEKQMYALMDRVVQTPIDDEAIDRYWPVFYEKLKDLPTEEIVLKFISTELNAHLDYYKGAGDLNADQEKGGRTQSARREKGEFNRNVSGPKKRFTLDLGENQNMNKGALVRLVCSETGVDSNHIGRIEIHSRFSYFEVDESVSNVVLPKIGQGTYEGKSYNVALSKDQDGGGSYTVRNYRGKSRSGSSYHGKKQGNKKPYKKKY
ncbi:MAG: DEAD/DEAH box helicase [Bacteroidetes bacterium]|nr:DEAD/DEAH box helicase [Bacteroidota bacterium]